MGAVFHISLMTDTQVEPDRVTYLQYEFLRDVVSMNRMASEGQKIKIKNGA